MEILISALVGGVIALIISLVFEEPLVTAKRRFVKWFRTAMYRRPQPLPKPETFALGNITTSWLVIDGDGVSAYTPKTITCRVENNPIPLSLEIQDLRASIIKREHAKKLKGRNSQWNGPMCALKKYAIGRTVPDEDLEVDLTFGPTDYSTFLATIGSLDQNLLEPPATLTLRQKYLHGRDLTKPIPSLANGFGVALVIITGDRKVILQHRQNSTGVRPGELDISVVEAVHPVRDRSDKARVSLYTTAIKGADEELGIQLKEKDITFLGFGVDTEYYQWNMIGVARIEELAEHALESRTRGTGGKWETKKIEIVDADPKFLLSYIRQQKIWATGLVAIYWALVQEFRKSHVDAVVKQVFK